MATVTVSRSGDCLIAVKQVPAEHIQEIEREAGNLQRIAHPGVVRFVALVETPDRGRALHTEFVSSDTWATRPLTDPAERAAGVAALAEVVADLHDMGFAHCQLHPSHVLHGDGDRPVLCGLRTAAEATGENRRGDLVALADLCHDPDLGQGPLVEKLSALADAARAGRLDVRELARRLAAVPEKRSTAAEPGRAAADGTGRGPRGRARTRLLVVAAVLGVSAAVLAAGIWSRGQRTSAPAAITDAASSPAAAAGDPAGASDLVGAVGAVPANAAATDPASTPADANPTNAALEPDGTPAEANPTNETAGPNLFGTPADANPTNAALERDGTPADANPTNATAATDPTSAPQAGTVPTGTATSRTDPADADIDGADPTGATAAHRTASPSPMVPGAAAFGTAVRPGGLTGSPGTSPGPGGSDPVLPPTLIPPTPTPPGDAAAHQRGAILEHGGSRYLVGAAGDFVATGDWDCDGEPTPAIIRPSTGHVVLFDTWPAAGQSVAMPVRWEVGTPTGAEAVAHGPCDLLRVYTPAGSRLLNPMETG